VALVVDGTRPRRLAFHSREAGSGTPRLVLTRHPTPSVPPPSSPGPSSPSPHGATGSWTLAFDDEFDGTSLDLSKWRPNWLSGSDTGVTKPVDDAELSCYDPRQVSVAGGALALTAEARRCTASNGVTYPYASGLVESRHDYTYTYGFAEARMLLPANTDGSRGAVGSCGPNWPAFWINGYGSSVGEIDVMECLGDDTRWTYHWDGYRQSSASVPAGWRAAMPRTADGWHTFGVNWQPNRLTFYYDGVEVGTQTVAVPTDPHYLIANLGVSGTRISAPQTVKIDYVRVWQ
jgi:beta-glucanase (GH16 family)